MSNPIQGKYFEQFEVGTVFKHAIRRTVTETDNLLFTVMTMNTQPLHLDEEYSKTESHAETEVMEKRESASRPNAGIVYFEHRGYNQRDELVAKIRRTALMKRCPA